MTKQAPKPSLRSRFKWWLWEAIRSLTYVVATEWQAVTRDKSNTGTGAFGSFATGRSCHPFVIAGQHGVERLDVTGWTIGDREIALTCLYGNALGIEAALRLLRRAEGQLTAGVQLVDGHGARTALWLERATMAMSVECKGRRDRAVLKLTFFVGAAGKELQSGEPPAAKCGAGTEVECDGACIHAREQRSS